MKSKQNKWTGNEIGAEGASAISESLKINTTLTELILGSDEIRNKQKKKKYKKNEQGTKLEIQELQR